MTTEIDSRYTAQKPYRNGVTLYRWSTWGGNGFGNDVRVKAVFDGRVIGEYTSSQTRVSSTLEGHAGFSPDVEWTGHGTNRRMTTTKTRYAKWLAAAKSWTPEGN